jgi:hypothetical protein
MEVTYRLMEVTYHPQKVTSTTTGKMSSLGNSGYSLKKKERKKSPLSIKTIFSDHKTYFPQKRSFLLSVDRSLKIHLAAITFRPIG